MNKPDGKTLLIVDDEAALRNLLGNVFRLNGCRVLEAGDIKSAMGLLEQEKVDVVISDVRMPGGDGTELLAWIRARDPKQPPVFLVTGFADVSPEEARNLGAAALMQKPFDLKQLVRIISEAMNG